MEKFEEMLGVLARNSIVSWLADKCKMPERESCPKCGKLMCWFWLPSDCEFFPSRWMKHLCICEIIYWTSWYLNRAIDEKERIGKEIEENPITKKYSARKISFLEEIIHGLEIFIQTKSFLLKELVDMQKTNDPNVEYLERRLDLAQKYDAWRILFDCHTESETEEIIHADRNYENEVPF